MKQDVENFVKQCDICQHAKHSLQHPMGLLQPLPILAGVWQDLTMDFIEGLPKSEGCSVIFLYCYCNCSDFSWQCGKATWSTSIYCDRQRHHICEPFLEWAI